MVQLTSVFDTRLRAVALTCSSTAPRQYARHCTRAHNRRVAGDQRSIAVLETHVKKLIKPVGCRDVQLTSCERLQPRTCMSSTALDGLIREFKNSNVTIARSKGALDAYMSTARGVCARSRRSDVQLQAGA